MDTYKPPSRKIPESCIFLVVLICSLQRYGIGRLSITKSVIMLRILHIVTTRARFMHLPLIVGSQLDAIG